MKKHLITLALLATASSAFAQDYYYWTGAALDSDYQNPANWVNWIGGGPASQSPPSNDWSLNVILTEATSPATKTIVNTPWGHRCRSLFMEDSGWEMAAALQIMNMTSRGVGTNMVNGQFQTLNNPTHHGVWTVESGNTFVTHGVYNGSYDGGVTLTGGGTVHVKGRNEGWGSEKYWSIHDALLRVDDTQPINRTEGGPYGTVYMSHKDARLQYISTVGNAKSHFGWLVLNNYKPDYNLVAKDIGDGYVEVSFAPPATLFFLQ